MHYYQFNIGDYSSHTSRLSNIEDLAYRRLLDLYYLNERPFNGCSTDVAREIGLTDFQQEVDYILCKYFPHDGDSYINKRADSEILAYHGKKKQQSDAGKRSAEARKTKAFKGNSNDRSTTVQPESNDRSTKHKPLTIKQETITIGVKTPRFAPPEIKQITEYFKEKGSTIAEGEKFFHFYDSKNWMIGKNKMQKWKSSAAGWISRNNGGSQSSTNENRFA